jgi:ABC-type bacteriocin/lantibiotic exporter with double-glycine peptidase domain
MSGNFKNFIILTLLIVIVHIVFFIILEYINQIFDAYLKNKIREYVVEEFALKFYEIPYSEVIRKDTGYFISRVYEEPTSAIIDSLDIFINTVTIFLNTVSLFIAMLILSPIATIIALPLVVISYILTKKFQPSIQDLTHKQLEYQALLRDRIGNFISSYVFVNTNKIRDIVKDHLSRILREFLNTNLRLTKTQANLSYISISFSLIVQVAFFIINGYLVFIRKITVGDFLGFSRAFYPFQENLQAIFEYIPKIISSISSLKRIEEFRKQRGEARNIEFSDGDIEIVDIEYSYDGHKVFDGFSLKIREGERVLIFGPNGSGKTTLLYIISGLLEPQKGKVKTKENISISTIGLLDIPIKEYLEVKVFQREKLEKFLKELNLDLNKKPSELSTGQLKKLSVALALSKPSSLYLLDEPLESVDLEDKRKLMEIILNETKRKTLILTTHDLIIREYLDNFDNVVEIKKEVEI